MSTRKALTLSLRPDIREVLDQLAREQDRSRSWLANRLIREGLAARGQAALRADPESDPRETPFAQQLRHALSSGEPA